MLAVEVEDCLIVSDQRKPDKKQNGIVKAAVLLMALEEDDAVIGLRKPRRRISALGP